MLKLNAGLSRKVGEPDYGSRGASVNLELEVEGHLVSEPDALLDRIRKLFSLARTAVDEELNGRRPATSNDRINGANGDANGGARKGSQSSNGRPATASQLRAIRSICERLKLDPEVLPGEKFGVRLENLSLKEASSLIDELKARPEGAGRSR